MADLEDCCRVVDGVFGTICWLVRGSKLDVVEGGTFRSRTKREEEL